MEYNQNATTFQEIHACVRQAARDDAHPIEGPTASETTTPNETKSNRTVCLPYEVLENITDLDITLTISVPKDKRHGYISYQTDTSSPNLLALATLLECVLIQLANDDKSPSTA